MYADHAVLVPRFGFLANTVGESTHNMHKELRDVGPAEAAYKFVNGVYTTFGERLVRHRRRAEQQQARTGSVAASFDGYTELAIKHYNERRKVRFLHFDLWYI